MSKVLRQNDTASRVGGDEFMAILHDIEDDASLQTVAEKLIRTIG
jgi:GGDEF domain-containing protein